MKVQTPETEVELAEIVRGSQEPLRVQGGGTRPIGVPVNGAPLSTAGLSGITLYEPGALTLVAQAGTPVSVIEAALKQEGQRLAFEPMDHRGLMGTAGTPTIGGVFAANVSGPRRIQVGAARDFLLGVRFVDGQGEIVSNGGRVMKNVTGYDLVKLLAGSYGTLGVLTEVSLKVLPGTPITGVLQADGLSDVDAVAAMSKALGSPFEISGAAHLQSAANGSASTLIRIEGTEASVAYRAKELQQKLAGFGDFTLETDPEKTGPIWEDIRDVAPFHAREGSIWRLSLKPSDAPHVVAQIPDAEAIYDWGGGLVWLRADAQVTSDMIRHAIGAAGGHATLLRGGRAGGVFPTLSAPVAALQAGLRAKFDPRGILNPGLMGQHAPLSA